MKRLLTVLLTLALLFSLTVPVWAAEGEEDPMVIAPNPTAVEEEYVPTDYDLGYDEAYGDAYNEGYEQGKADFAAGKPCEPEDREMAESEETYEDGLKDGAAFGYFSGYYEGYQQEYMDGYDSVYDSAYDQGYADGLAAGKARQPQALAEIEYSDTYTYEDGQTEGRAAGYQDGYMAGYDEGSGGKDMFTDQEILDKGGVPGQINVMFDGQCVQFPDKAPEAKNQRTMVPVRAVMESMGAEVDYDKTDKSVTITLNGSVVHFPIGSDTYTVTKDGVTTEKKMDTAAYATQNRTMVPVRFLSEASGYTVLWDQDHKTAVIVDQDQLIADVDSKFTAINKVIDANLSTQKGKKLETNAELNGKFTYYDETAKATTGEFSGAMNAYTDGAAARIDVSLNVESLVDALLDSDFGLSDLGFGLGGMDMGEGPDAAQVLKALLKADLTDVTLSLLLDQDGRMWVHSPLLIALLAPEAVSDSSDDAWVSLGALLGTDLQLDLANGFTVGSLIVPTALQDEGSFHYRDSVDAAVEMLDSLLGDKAVKQDGDVYTWTLTIDSLLAALGLDAGESEEIGEMFQFNAVIQMDLKGNYDLSMDLRLDMEPFSVITAGLEAKGDQEKGHMGLSASMADLFDLSLVLDSVTKEVETLPALTLPAGAEIVE